MSPLFEKRRTLRPEAYAGFWRGGGTFARSLAPPLPASVAELVRFGPATGIFFLVLFVLLVILLVLLVIVLKLLIILLVVVLLLHAS